MRGNEKTATGKGQIEHRGNEKKIRRRYRKKDVRFAYFHSSTRRFTVGFQ